MNTPGIYCIINNTGKYLDRNGKFTLTMPFCPEVYSTVNESEAQSKAKQFANCSVKDAITLLTK